MKESMLGNPHVFKILLSLALVIIVFNLLVSFSTVLGASLTGKFSGTQTQTQTQTNTAQGSAVTQGAMLPYGITFDQAGYDKLIGSDNSIGQSTMTKEQWQRYVKIGTGDRTGCGPCCSIQDGPALDANGNSRCGCGHIHALEGLMKYLVTQYGDKYTDAQIFSEIVKWKQLFFPGQVANDGSVIK